ncbi:MAG: ornithine cyclodeaminase family protein [Pseudomonadota bacterium]
MMASEEESPGADSASGEWIEPGTIYFLSEADVVASVTQADVTAAVEVGFASLAAGQAFNFPVVRRKLDHENAIFGFKSAFDRAAPTLGIKAGGLWPGNRERGVPNHQSTIMLFDPASGAPAALVCGTYLTALRTAAASALSVRYLARDDARTLAITAAGGQGEAQLRACLSERSFDRILLPERDSGAGQRLKDAVRDLAAEIEIVPMEPLCRGADVLITMALSFAPYVEREWIRPGTHVACMGTDTIGKQEVEATLFARGEVFGDAPDQNALLGECQHAVAAGLMSKTAITPLGEVISGSHGGRRSVKEITLFDSTGMGMQDLAAAEVALRKALAANRYTSLSQHGGSH